MIERPRRRTRARRRHGSASISCASLLTPYGSDGPIGSSSRRRLGRLPVDQRGASDEHGHVQAGVADGLEQVVRAEHVDAQRADGSRPRFADMRRSPAQ